MTYAQIREEIFRRLEESSVSPDFFDTNINDLIVEAFIDFAEAAEWAETVLTLVPNDSGSGVRYYNMLDEVTTVEMLTPRSAYNFNLSRFMDPVTYQELDDGRRAWELSVGEPTHFLVRGAWWIGTYPLPAPSYTGNIGIFCSIVPLKPNLPTDDAQSPGFDAEFHEALVEYCLADLFEDERETKKAGEAFSKYIEHASRLRRRILTRGSRDVVRFMGR